MLKLPSNDLSAERSNNGKRPCQPLVQMLIAGLDGELTGYTPERHLTCPIDNHCISETDIVDYMSLRVECKPL
jgi:hypothetical protein